MDDIDQLLASIEPTVKASFDSILKPVAPQQQNPKAQSKQQRLEHLKQQRRSALVPIAQTWLAQLNPNTAEGRWFDEFACHYESRLEAAIDYLEALQEVDLS